MRELCANEIDFVSGSSEWGDNVVKYAGIVGAIGAFGGLKGAAAGILVGAAIGTVITIID